MASMLDRADHGAGTLVFVTGPSGSGKDSLLAFARERLATHPGFLFAHRYITRPFDAGGENHLALTRAEFESRRARGLFAMCWEGHGNAYGIGIEIDHWLGQGMHVIVNGSRAYLLEAQRRYPQVLPVTIRVRPDTLAQRLRARGREDEAAISERLRRHPLPQGGPGIQIDNDGPLADAGNALLAVLLGLARENACVSHS